MLSMCIALGGSSAGIQIICEFVYLCIDEYPPSPWHIVPSGLRHSGRG